MCKNDRTENQRLRPIELLLNKQCELAAKKFHVISLLREFIFARFTLNAKKGRSNEWPFLITVHLVLVALCIPKKLNIDHNGHFLLY
jgi:hypothetical protein